MSAFIAFGALALSGVAAFFAWHTIRGFRNGVTWSTRFPNVRYARTTDPMLYWIMMALNVVLTLMLAAIAAFAAIFLAFPNCSSSPLINQILAC